MGEGEGEERGGVRGYKEAVSAMSYRYATSQYGCWQQKHYVWTGRTVDVLAQGGGGDEECGWQRSNAVSRHVRAAGDPPAQPCYMRCSPVVCSRSRLNPLSYTRLSSSHLVTAEFSSQAHCSTSPSTTRRSAYTVSTCSQSSGLRIAAAVPRMPAKSPPER
jgi:hypothetical protein